MIYLHSNNEIPSQLESGWLYANWYWSYKGSTWRFQKDSKVYAVSKKENATETYAELKEEYLTIKALLQVSGVNLTDVDKIKE